MKFQFNVPKTPRKQKTEEQKSLNVCHWREISRFYDELSNLCSLAHEMLLVSDDNNNNNKNNSFTNAINVTITIYTSQYKLPATDLKLFQVRPLHVDHRREQLVLQAVPRDGEVDEGALCLQLGWEMGVRQLRVEDEPESGVEVTFLVPDLNVPEIRATGA